MGAYDLVGELMGRLMEENFPDGIPRMAEYQPAAKGDLPLGFGPSAPGILKIAEGEKGRKHFLPLRGRQNPESLSPLAGEAVKDSPFQLDLIESLLFGWMGQWITIFPLRVSPFRLSDGSNIKGQSPFRPSKD
jgi:hypothetical protein